MHAIKLTPIGDEVGIVLPAEILARLNPRGGDTVFLTETPHGLVLTAHDPALLDQLEAGLEFLGDFHDTFQALTE